MGLDSVELLMEVEIAFNIRIPDEEAEKIITVGDFHNAVWRHLEGRHIDRCHSQSLFYTLRTSLSQTYGLQPDKLKLSDPPNELFPLTNRREAYLAFERDLGMQLPALELPDPWSDLLFWTGILLIGGGLVTEIVLINFFDYSAWILLWTLVAIFAVVALSELLNPLRTVIKTPTLKEYTVETLSLNYQKLAQDMGTNRKEMETVINHIIVNKIGVDILEITPEKRIADDLGVD